MSSQCLNETVAKCFGSCRQLTLLFLICVFVSHHRALLICESMKIETTIRAQVAGKLRLHVQNGDTVPEGKLLCQVGGEQQQQQQQ